MINGGSDQLLRHYSGLYAKQCLPDNKLTHARIQHELCFVYMTYAGSDFDTESAVNVDLDSCKNVNFTFECCNLHKIESHNSKILK